MKRTNMRKVFAVLISAAMLLGLLAGCNNAGDTNTTGATTDTTQMIDPIASGMLVLHANGAVNVSYDNDGLVLSIEGADKGGEELIAEYTDYLGESCADVICTLIKRSQNTDNAEMNKYVMIKQAFGSTLPGTNFLEELTTDAKAALETVKSSAKLIVLTEEDLDAKGYINLESAKDLVLAYLSLDSFDSFDGTTAPVDGVYGFNIVAGNVDEDLLVDATTGSVYSGILNNQEDDSLLDPDEIVDTEPTEEEPEVIVTEPTTAPTEDPSSDHNEETTSEDASSEG